MSSKSEKLQERLAAFAAAVDDLINCLPSDPGGQNIARQLVRCSTSPLANYCEACEAESAADYIHKVKVAVKELRETRGWIVYIGKRARPTIDVTELIREADELISILVTCIKRARGND